MPTHLSICIYKGDPLDAPIYRHTSLHLTFPDSSSLLLHITGSRGAYTFEELPNYHPSTGTHAGPDLVRQIPVKSFPDSVGKVALYTVIASTKVRNVNVDADWNCQHWVADALTRLCEVGWMSGEEREEAVSQMLDVCLEGEDEA